jgi:hypothetical protein
MSIQLLDWLDFNWEPKIPILECHLHGDSKRRAGRVRVTVGRTYESRWMHNLRGTLSCPLHLPERVLIV